ncbi:MAG TPA: alkaline phosphatase family protein [Solirubrobacteraceae bacterium]|jgi:phospholipase C|nr:alkaline phosphatase family protein [Solirubrobacteraceae bacterium]
MARKRVLLLLVAVFAVAGASVAVAQASTGGRSHHHDGDWGGGGQGGGGAGGPRTTTPIKHLVVIFQENVSFDHYFGTYPHAANTDGQPFYASPRTPTVNGLSGALLTNNPNLSNPQRLSYSQAATCDQDHDYTDEQSAFDHGLMDMFVQKTGSSLTLAQCLKNEGNPAPAGGTDPNYAVMDYYDGNTVTGLWNYAQHFAMSDNSYGTNFGPSTPGAINVTGTNTFGATCGGDTGAVYPAAVPSCGNASSATPTPGHPQPAGPGTVYSDSDPAYDVCSAGKTIGMGGKNIGDLLDQSGISWGWFEGGFASPGYVPGQPSTDDLTKVCTTSHKNILGSSVSDYSAHHEPFEYYLSTANPKHLPPTSIAMIGHQDQANHQYDLSDFFAAADNGNLPAVSYLKAPRYQDGHAGYSDPIDEQTFLTSTINHLEKLRSWKSTAVIVLYDDSDGWYDHQIGPIVSQSQTTLDTLTNPGQCGANPAKVPTTDSGTPEQARCGVGPRQPLLVISPFAKRNFVDGTFTDQSSVVQLIEDNWLGRQRIGNGGADATAGTLDNLFSFHGEQNSPLFLNPSTGEPSRGW